MCPTSKAPLEKSVLLELLYEYPESLVSGSHF